jgi:CDP-paratose 2-epimerase
MKRKTILVTGSSGLICSEGVAYFDLQGHRMDGVDNNMQREFCGPAGDTLWNLERLKGSTKNFVHENVDIRDRAPRDDLFREQRFDVIVHCAAQPSLDKARDIPILDFEMNALGTVNLLEATGQHSLEAAFVFASVYKVYGDAPNEIPLQGLDARYDMEEARKGDYICYISNIGEFRTHYLNWRVTRSLDSILEEMIAEERSRRTVVSA